MPNNLRTPQRIWFAITAALILHPSRARADAAIAQNETNETRATSEPSQPSQPSGPTEPTDPVPVVAAPPAPRPGPAPRAKYSLPFQLRPVTTATVVRSDSSFARYENAAAQGGFAFVSELTGAYRIPGTGDAPGTGLAPLVKLTIVNDSPPGTLTGGFAFVNP